MRWPKELLDVFARALKIKTADGLDKVTVIRSLLDETARRVVWRAKGNPADVSAALRSPYTPLGSVVADGVNGQARRIGLGGPAWGVAVDALYTYVEENAEAVFAAFRDQGEPYPDDLTRG
jgi:hypothetical protein